MFRSIGAVILGFLSLVILVLVTTPVAVKLLLKDPSQRPTPAYLFVNLLFGFACAAAGGWIAGHLAHHARLAHAAALATIVLLLGTWTAAQGGAVRAGQPLWYAWTLPFIGAVGALVGGAW